MIGGCGETLAWPPRSFLCHDGTFPLDKVWEESSASFVLNGQCSGGKIRYTRGVVAQCTVAVGKRVGKGE